MMNESVPSVSLVEIIKSFPLKYFSDSIPGIAIKFVTADSRKVIPGSIFVACTGQSADGHIYIENAITSGAVTVFGEKDIKDCRVPYIRVENSRQALAYLAAAFYGNPAKKLVMIGVTGTDGKTTTSNLIYSILKTAGLKVGMISTVNAIVGDRVLDTGFHVTTPDAPDVQRFLAMMCESGITHVVLETTSHGWEQYRVDACEFDIGVITNITHEHLDQHGSFENYRAAKARLFQSLGETKLKNGIQLKLAVLNQDDSSYQFLKDLSRVDVITYGMGGDADFTANGIKNLKIGTEFLINYFGNRQVKINSNLVGEFNIFNNLAAFTTAVVGLGIDPDVAARGLAEMDGVPGRMEQIHCGQQFTAIVDFAHTPNALKVALQTARKMTKGQLIVVFGSAGLRDRQKRKLMAEIAIEMADFSIFTAEDPRTESLDLILDEMAEGAKTVGGIEGGNFWRIPDRGNAIRKAIRIASQEDLVICCGKGHEQSMCFGTVEYAWDDRTALRAAISEYLHIEGPIMPYLPTQGPIE